MFICYTNTKSRIKSWDIVDDVDEWKANHNHPEIKINAIFSDNHNIIEQTNNMKTTFMNLCHLYDLKPENYEAEYLNKKENSVYILTGILPKNHKYKIQVTNKESRAKYKVHPKWFHANYIPFMPGVTNVW